MVATASAADPGPLELEGRVLLGDVRGRIDHMAIDEARQRLFVAELGNDSVAVVDLVRHDTLRTIDGLKEPQGVGYVASTDTLYVANAGDGTVRLYQGADLIPAGAIKLGDDADNVRVEDADHRVYVGYGSGGLAVIDTGSKRKIADIPLRAHPESFQLDSASGHLYINIPDAHQIAVVDVARGRQIATWSTDSLRSNFPMALDLRHHQVVAVFRHPATVGAFAADSGKLLFSSVTCGDSDDVFHDAKRDRLYVSCGDGFIEVFARERRMWKSIGRTATASNVRTSFFAAAADRLYLAFPASGANGASIWVYRPTP